jgi:hypothetical protein
MVIIMDMHTGKVIGEPDGYDEEVLNANWLPPQPEVAARLQAHEPAVTARPLPPMDVDDFLQGVYRYQE